MTRWQLIWLAVKILCRLFFRRDISSVLDIFAPKAETVPDTVETVAAKAPRMAYDVIKSRLTHIGILVLAFASYAAADGYFNAYDGLTKINKRISGGEGIDIANGVIRATGSAVISGSIPYKNISSAGNAAYLGKTATATSTNAYKGNSLPSATEFGYMKGVTAPVQGQISSAKVAFNLYTSVDRPARYEVATAAQGAKADTSLQSANYPVKNALALGIVNTGGDQGSAIQALFDGAVNNDTFYFPKGNYGTTIQLKLPSDKMVRIIGDGPGATTFSALAPLRSVFLKEGQRIEGIEFRDFAIEGNIPSYAQIGITLRSGVETKIENVYISRTSEAGLAFGIPSAWDSSKTYHQYQYITYLGHIFRSLQNTNSNHTPVVGGDSWWTDLETYDVASNGLIYDTRMKSVTLRSGNSPTQGMFGIHQYASANDNWIGNCIIANYSVANIFDEAGYTFYHKVYMNGSPLSSSPTYGIWSVTQFTSAAADAGITVEQSYFDGIGPTGGSGAAIRLDKGGNLITSSTFYRGSTATTNAGVEMKSGITRTTISSNRFDNVVPVAFQSGGTYGTEYNFTGNIGGLSPGSTTNIINSVPVGTAAIAGLNSVTNDAQLKASQLVTSVGSPGSDTSVPSEKAVRSAIAAVPVYLSDPGSNGIIKRTSVNTTTSASSSDVVSLFNGGTCSGYLKSDGTCSTPATGTGDVLGPVSATDGNLAQFDGPTGKLLKNGPAFGSFIGATTIPITDSNGVIQLYATNKVNGLTVIQDTTSTSRNPALQVRNFANGTAGIPRNTLRNSNGTFGSDSAIIANQWLGSYGLLGYTGVGDVDGASIAATAESNWTTVNQPTSLRFLLGTTGGNGTATEKMLLNSSGFLGVGTSSPISLLEAFSSSTNAVITATSVTDSAASPSFTGRRAGGVSATPTATQSGMSLFLLSGLGNYGPTWHSASAYINMPALENFTSGAKGTAITFATTAPTTTTRTEKLKIWGGGGISVNPVTANHADPGAGNLTVSGNITAKMHTGTIPAATTYGATTTIDLSLGDSPSVTLTGSPTLAFSNPVAGQWHTLELIQDATGGRTVTWPSSGLVCTWRNADGTTTAPTQVTTANSRAYYLIHTKSTTAADCFAR